MTMECERHDRDDLDPADHIPLASGTVEGTPDVTGQPGVESALGRERRQGERPPEMGTNRLTDPASGALTGGQDQGARR